MNPEIGNIVRFIHKNVNWQGRIIDINNQVLSVAVEGYPCMFYISKGESIIILKNK